MREAIYYYLSNFAGLTSLVGSRIYPQRVPTGKGLPYLSFTLSNRQPNYDQDGYDEWNTVFFEFECVATTLKEASDVANQLFNAWDIQFQDIGDTTKIYVHSTTLESDFDDDDLFDGSEDGYRKITQTYSIRYKES